MKASIKDYKAFLQNKKDVYTSMWVIEMQKQPMNLREIARWNNKVVHADEMLQELEKENKA